MCFLTAAKPRKTKRRKCHERIQDNGKIVPDTRMSFRDATVEKENIARNTTGYEWPLFYFFPEFLLNKSGLSKIRLIKRRQACNSHWREWRRDFSDRLLSVGALLWSSEAVGSDSLRFDSAGWILNHQRQSPFIQIWPLVKTLCCWFIQPNCVVSNKRRIVLCNKCCNRRKTWVVCIRSSISYS